MDRPEVTRAACDPGRINLPLDADEVGALAFLFAGALGGEPVVLGEEARQRLLFVALRLAAFAGRP